MRISQAYSRLCKIEEEEETSGGAMSFHAPILETSAAGPSARVRPRVTDGGGSKADNQIEDERSQEGQEGQAESRGPAMSDERDREHAMRPVEGQETSMQCGRWRAKKQRVTNNDGRMTPLRGEHEEETSGGATTLHAPVLETPAGGPSARVRPRVTDGGSSKAGNQSEEDEEASIIEACAIEEEIATDAASDGAETLHTPVLEISATGREPL